MKFRPQILFVMLAAALMLAAGRGVFASVTALEGRDVVNVSEYEGRAIAGVEIVFENAARDETAEAELLAIVRATLGTEYAAVRVRESLVQLLNSGLVSSARVEALDAGRAVRLRYVIRRQLRVGRVDLVITPQPTTGSPVSADELRARLNLLEPSARVTEQVLKNNADLIQAYLRDRGFYHATVDYAQTADATGTRAAITYRVNLGEQSVVKDFNLEISGLNNPAHVHDSLKLQKGVPFTRELLNADLKTIRQAIIDQGNLAPQLENAKVNVNEQGVTILVKGGVGPKVSVDVKEYAGLKEKEERNLLPVKREGNIDVSAIVEGERRLRNRLQENGYFFAEVTSVCTVTPAAPADDGAQNGTREMCESLNPEALTGRAVNITYNVEAGRRFKLTDIRIEGTNKLTYEDVAPDLRTEKANALGFIPYLGYGRGYTSRDLLEQDRRTIEARMRDLGYRRAHATVRQGVSINGESLIITFVVDEGPLTRVAGVEVRGNQIYTEQRLRNELGTVAGGAYSRSQARADGDRILSLYSSNGYLDARVDFSTVDLPDKMLPGDQREEQVRLVYTVRSEGEKVFINQIRINTVGPGHTKNEAILEAIPLHEGDILRSDKLNESERLLYETGAFQTVTIRTQNAGETATGYKKRDVFIDLEEVRPRRLEYGGGYSTDNGPLGFVEIRHDNLFGKLQQGAARIRASRRTQLVRLEFLDPRFRHYGESQFSPLTISLQYLRDTTITRFFRSTIDRGNFGIVQRLDKNGNPINELGEKTGAPTINRLTFNIETQRVLNSKTRSIVFLRYSYEDVRLFNISSLLIAPILRPDQVVRTSRLGASFVRDTRQECGVNTNAILRLQGNAGGPTTAHERCQYSQTDATRGDYLSVDYSLSLRQLGGNLSFNKLLTTYRRYYQIHRARGTVLAGNLTLGLANLFNPRDRNGNGVIDDQDRTLPISERFFSGGSTTLRGFDYEEAGPRRAITFLPGETFRNQKGKVVFLNPFLVPVGGNAEAVVNLEARMPVSKLMQVVPFYDGGNVFRHVGDIFHRGSDPLLDPNLRAHWTNTVGLGLRFKTPIGGALAVDYGFLLNPPEFLLPQLAGPDAVIRLKSSRLHFRFTQTF